ncbi:hypothetical protein C8A00DRAFT_33236 [Chaetomidium leptoderma]|uniref:C2H2-type domain-containing protein n=1 Tax=Chaetomidium leptoderma TaxID=669021 RepID=A0AAN6ZXK6_9PEZI|nr:hypothetical protein C8A00DRAFT_33236 [Chaetomidium leptoderma]
MAPKRDTSNPALDLSEELSPGQLSIETEALSISEDSEDEFLGSMDPDNPVSPLVEVVARRLLEEFRKATVIRIRSPGTHEGPSHAAPECAPPPSQQPIQHTPRPCHGRDRPAKDHDKDSDEEEARERQPKKRKLGGPPRERPTKFLACPFWKLDPREHRCCFKLTLDGIARVKQHLNRKHAPQFYCEYCMEILPDNESHRRHVESRTCTYRACSFSGITHQQQRELSRRSRPNSSERERWFAIWDIVFPGRPRPASPHIDTELSEDLCQFMEFVGAPGPAAIAAAEVLRENTTMTRINDGGRSTNTAVPEEEEQDTAALLERAITRGFSLMFEQWLAERDSHPTPVEHAQQPTQPTIVTPSDSEPSGSSGGQSSSRGVAPLHQDTRTSSASLVNNSAAALHRNVTDLQWDGEQEWASVDHGWHHDLFFNDGFGDFETVIPDDMATFDIIEDRGHGVSTGQACHSAPP